MEDVKAKVKAKIDGKKVMVFSKRTCPFCANAKKAFDDLIARKELSRSDYEVWEIGGEKDCGDIQKVLEKLTGKKTVPRVFINGKCIGGGEDTLRLWKNGKIAKMLSQ